MKELDMFNRVYEEFGKDALISISKWHGNIRVRISDMSGITHHYEMREPHINEKELERAIHSIRKLKESSNSQE